MTDTVTDEMVEIAAEATYEQHEIDLIRGDFGAFLPWELLDEPLREVYRYSARAALSATLPLVVAGERERCARIAETFPVQLYGKDLVSLADGRTVYASTCKASTFDDLAAAIRLAAANDAPAETEGE